MKKDSIIYYIIGAIVVGLAIAFVAGMFFADTTEKSARVFFEKVLLPGSINNWQFDKFKGYYGRKAAPAAGFPEEEKLKALFTLSSEKLGSLTSFSGISSEKTEYIDIESGKTVFVDLSSDAVFTKGSARLKARLVQSEDSWRVMSFDVISAALTAQPVEQSVKPDVPAAKKAVQDASVKADPKKVLDKPKEPQTVKPVIPQPTVPAVKKSEQPAVKELPKPQAKPDQKKSVQQQTAVPAEQAKTAPQKQTQKTELAQALAVKLEQKEEKAAVVAALPKPVTYAYDQKNRRDPFYPLIVKAAPEKKPGLTPLENYEISDFKLIAILSEKAKGFYAVVTLPNSRSYNIREGSKIGLHDGKVLKINKDSVVIREYHRDLKGILSPRDIILKLRRGEEG
ncbi:MAG: pilus assembly protein PilP [Nitrospirae bacterium]|nr:pilus assembly protein PilP [Nitrospirota bacterium]